MILFDSGVRVWVGLVVVLFSGLMFVVGVLLVGVLVGEFIVVMMWLLCVVGYMLVGCFVVVFGYGVGMLLVGVV